METKYYERYIKLGLKIQYYRKLRGFTQETFAEAIDKSWSFISKIESPTTIRGVSLETLFKMADVLEIEPYKLIKDDD
ncbi:DNA-binding helix-turn-helix protein [[Clostridium] methylpentosum DSM 5476]|uniref:DNA-binding helix-turn-helix protein n=1 Tax=[Clostridium] methylpentosum DSM 5476 TaxID=537013 RepID=C0EIG8_9FIRM|nr:DNA-binding helix-turn-helix protein [[Clostridium] methylpentosum DSM 5476]MDY3989085.1 helix-turn-helix transcriptional regulator [Massilioclostridium sp.]MEE1491991.1 helix-turn-helix transcriptional regulator [Massilioclostridium sp.]